MQDDAPFVRGKAEVLPRTSRYPLGIRQGSHDDVRDLPGLVRVLPERR